MLWAQHLILLQAIVLQIYSFIHHSRLGAFPLGDKSLGDTFNFCYLSPTLVKLNSRHEYLVVIDSSWRVNSQRLFYWQILYIPHFHGNKFEFDQIGKFYSNHDQERSVDPWLKFKLERQTLESECSKKRDGFKLGVTVSSVDVPTELWRILVWLGTLYPAAAKRLDSRFDKRRFRKQHLARINQILAINFLER